MSVAIYVFLIYFRHDLTPQLMHFMACATVEEVYFVTVTFYWLFWKNFLMLDEKDINKFNASTGAKIQ